MLRNTEEAHTPPWQAWAGMVVCGVGVHLWVVDARSEWLLLGLLADRGPKRERRKASKKSVFRMCFFLPSLRPLTPTRNDRRAVFPVFVSCFRFFRRDGMFQDGSVSAAVTHLVRCGGGYAGLPDACMCASLKAAVSWLVPSGLPCLPA
jgi:hypothetical protein